MSATPQEESATLRDLVQVLIDGGVLNWGQGYALVSGLEDLPAFCPGSQTHLP